ncbi:MAG: response regulator transcription factor [Anaerolineales bacterium]|nr:response regulator transcription factor [Anaerolineales bacterium]
MNKITILLADDHNLFREGLAGILNSQPDMQVIGQANDGLEAILMAEDLKPDLVLMDIQMPGCDGLEATRKIKNEIPKTVVVMLTVRDEDEKLFEAIKFGAQGYLLKSIRSREMLDMVRGAMRGEAAISPRLASRMLDEFRRMSRILPAQSDDDIVDLTLREQEVLALAASGAADKEIASSLNISLATVKTHMRNILAKLQVNSRREAAREAKRRGLLGF